MILSGHQANCILLHIQENALHSRISIASGMGRRHDSMVKIVEGAHHPDAHVDVIVIKVAWGSMADIMEKLTLPRELS